MLNPARGANSRKALGSYSSSGSSTSHPNRALSGNNRIAELQLENSRLRRLVTDLLLEKVKLEEAGQRTRIFGVAGRRRASHKCLLRASTRADRTSTIEQCLNLEQEIHHPASKPRILGFEPLN